MSTEIPVDLDLDAMPPGGLEREMGALEKRSAPLVTFAASAENQEGIKKTLCALRASGLSPLLVLRRSELPLTIAETLSFLSFLRDWDQLLLRNILEVGADKIPSAHLTTLQQEARTELKWFQEWQTAVADPRIHRYPGLPWRSFLRKVNAENFLFAEKLLEGEGDQNQLIQAFLVSKKKTICIFPKNWGKR